MAGAGHHDTRSPGALRIPRHLGAWLGGLVAWPYCLSAVRRHGGLARPVQHAQPAALCPPHPDHRAGRPAALHVDAARLRRLPAECLLYPRPGPGRGRLVAHKPGTLPQRQPWQPAAWRNGGGHADALVFAGPMGRVWAPWIAADTDSHARYASATR